MGYRKLAACLAGIASCTACVMLDYIDGNQYVSVMGICIGGFLTANALSSKPKA